MILLLSLHHHSCKPNYWISTLLLSMLLGNSTWASVQSPPDEELRKLLKKAVAEADSFQDKYDAETWLLDMSTRLQKKLPTHKKRVTLIKHIHYEATRAKLPPELILAIIEVESNFDRFAISKAGAIGLMQIMPFWLKEIGRPDDNLFVVRTNLRYGCTILRYYLDMEKGNLTHALARYNGSRYSNRYTKKIFRALDKRWRKY